MINELLDIMEAKEDRTCYLGFGDLMNECCTKRWRLLIRGFLKDIAI